MVRRKTARAKSIAILLAVTLGGGTLLGTCQSRFKDAFVQGGKQYLYNDSFPSLLSDPLLGGYAYDEG